MRETYDGLTVLRHHEVRVSTSKQIPRIPGNEFGINILFLVERADELEDQLIDGRQVALPGVSDGYTIHASRQHWLLLEGCYENRAI
jgi:hypothetical protein